MKKGALLKPILTIFSIVIILQSCSTTKNIPEGEYRLSNNIVTITNHQQYPQYKISDIQSYVKQKPNSYIIKGKKNGWNPFIYVYNWTNGKGKGWDRFVQKIGQAPVIFDSTLVADSKTNMLTHLEFLGYYGSSIKDTIETQKKRAYVKYDVTLGKQYPIKEIKYIVRDTSLRKIFLSDSASFMIKKGIPLSEKILDAESDRAAKFLRNQGYYDFSKNYFFFEADTLSSKDSSLLEVTIENYTRNELPKDAKTHRRFLFGKIYVYPVSDLTRYRASLSLRLPTQYDTLEYKDITVMYDKKRKIRPVVLNKMNRIVPGEYYQEDIVNSTYQRFSNLRMYSSVNVQMDKVDSNVVDCTIRLLPTKMNGYKLNLEASTNSTGLIGISPAISYNNRNIFRGGEWLSLSVKGNFQFSFNSSIRATEVSAGAGLSFPTFLFLPDRIFKTIVPRTDISLVYNFQQRPEFTRNMIGGKFGYTWNSKSNKFYYQVYPLQINIVNMTRVSPSFLESLKNPFVKDTYKNHFEIGGGTIISYMTDPSINPQQSNFKANLSLDGAGNILCIFNQLMPRDTSGYRTIWDSPYAQFVRGELSLVYTWKFGKDNRQALAVRGVGGIGYSYGNSSTLPFERLFWVGGANSLRGWAAREVGPGSSPRDTSFSIPNQTGDVKIEANIEYRFPIFWKFYGAVFFDWGNVWNIRKSSEDDKNDAQLTMNNLFKTSALNTGLGIRLDIQFVVIRFDWGVKLYDPVPQQWRSPREWLQGSGYSFQFSIGYPF